MLLRNPPRSVQCETCIFRPESEKLLRPGRLAEIQAYLLRGVTHICHHGLARKKKRYACRGGRDFQLTIWHRLGIIAEPTDESLALAMKAGRSK